MPHGCRPGAQAGGLRRTFSFQAKTGQSRDDTYPQAGKRAAFQGAFLGLVSLNVIRNVIVTKKVRRPYRRRQRLFPGLYVVTGVILL